MIYQLRCMVSGIPGHREISAEQFHEFRTARQSLAELLSIEENYNGLLDRYIAMQRELVTVILQVELHRPLDGIEFHGYSQRLAREAACLLSVGRQYLDHTDHSLAEIGRLTGLPPLPFGVWRSEEYDKRFGYRVVEALRNASQHQMLPSQGISIGGSWVEESDGRQRRHRASLRVYPRKLEKNSRFKKKVLEELLAAIDGKREDHLDLMELVKGHLTGLSVIHERIREGFTQNVLEWEALIEDTLSSWRQEFGKDIALNAVAQYEPGRYAECIPLFGDYLARRRRMVEQNWAGEHTFDFHVQC